MCRISDTRSCATTVFGCLSESCVGSLAPEGHSAALYDHDSSTANCAAQWGGGGVGGVRVQHFCFVRVSWSLTFSFSTRGCKDPCLENHNVSVCVTTGNL